MIKGGENFRERTEEEWRKMQMKFGQRKSALFLCAAMLAAMPFAAAGCSDTVKDTPPAASTMQESVPAAEQELGEGNTKFTLTVSDQEGSETVFAIHTDKETVGEALEELGLIAGEEGEYGLYVKTVNGITADYDKDGVYWAFYINDEYAVTGVDSTTIAAEDSYAFKLQSE